MQPDADPEARRTERPLPNYNSLQAPAGLARTPDAFVDSGDVIDVEVPARHGERENWTTRSCDHFALNRQHFSFECCELSDTMAAIA